LGENPEYIALSYTWGDPTANMPIHLNGKHFWVAANLHTALVQFRANRSITADQTKPPYWIDAVCINQSHENEKASQIKMMKEIYEKAAHVHAWCYKVCMIKLVLLAMVWEDTMAIYLVSSHAASLPLVIQTKLHT